MCDDFLDYFGPASKFNSLSSSISDKKRISTQRLEENLPGTQEQSAQQQKKNPLFRTKLCLKKKKKKVKTSKEPNQLRRYSQQKHRYHHHHRYVTMVTVIVKVGMGGGGHAGTQVGGGAKRYTSFQWYKNIKSSFLKFL